MNTSFVLSTVLCLGDIIFLYKIRFLFSKSSWFNLGNKQDEIQNILQMVCDGHWLVRTDVGYKHPTSLYVRGWRSVSRTPTWKVRPAHLNKIIQYNCQYWDETYKFCRNIREIFLDRLVGLNGRGGICANERVRFK